MSLYDAFEQLDDERKIGVVCIEQGILTIQSILNESERESFQASLDEFNNRPFLVEVAPPKKQEKGMGAKEYQRGDEGFEEILIQKLRSQRMIELRRCK